MMKYDRNPVERAMREGIVHPAPCSPAEDTCYLFIGLGGYGIDVLYGIKSALSRNIPNEQLRGRVAFLGVDTDEYSAAKREKVVCRDGSMTLVETDRLTGDEFYLLSANRARSALHVVDENLDTWLSPTLRERIEQDPMLLTESGACGIRQIGRLRMYPGATVQGLLLRLSAVLDGLTKGSKLRIFTAAGLSGGTGSGILVDFGYLLRAALGAHPTWCRRDAHSAGILLLPPVGKTLHEMDRQRGNRNAYAAMKEINYYMTLGSKGGEYVHRYGNGQEVRSWDNLFDACYLLDGCVGNCMMSDPYDYVVKGILPQMILQGAITETPSGQALLSRITEDERAFAHSLLARTPVELAPRDVDYVFRIPGFKSVSAAKHEMRAYLGALLFDPIYTALRHCYVTEEDVQYVVKSIIEHGVSTMLATRKAVDEVLGQCFMTIGPGRGGPYYLEQLCPALLEALARLQSKHRLFRPHMVSTESLEWIAQCIRHLQPYWEIASRMMDDMKALTVNEHGKTLLVTSTEKRHSFLPRELFPADGRAAVIQYLQSKVNSFNLRQMTDILLRCVYGTLGERETLALGDRLMDWHWLPAVEACWNELLEQFVDCGMDDLLLKAQTGDPDARCDTMGTETAMPYLRRAAETLLNELLGEATAPIAQLQGVGLRAQHFNSAAYLLMPKGAPLLERAVREILLSRADQPPVTLCQAHSEDTVSCFKQYTAVPACKLAWTHRGKPDYMRPMHMDCGVHMTEGTAGPDWRTQADLLSESMT